MLTKVSLRYVSEGVVRLKSQISAGLLEIAVTLDDEDLSGFTARCSTKGSL
jgi:hypothetical protein